MSRSDPVGCKKCTVFPNKNKTCLTLFSGNDNGSDLDRGPEWEKTEGRPQSRCRTQQRQQQQQLGTQSLSSVVCLALGIESGVLCKRRALPWMLPPPLHSFYKCPFHVIFSLFLVWVHFFFHERSAQNKITKARGKLAFLACFSLGRKMYHKIQEFLSRPQAS